MPFGYDGSETILSIQFRSGETSAKQQCSDRNSSVCFTVYDELSPGTWGSVIITGERLAMTG